MASRPGSIDGRSPDVEVRYDGPENPPRLHVLALGISTYQRRALRYAHSDAEEIANFLHQRGIVANGEPGLRLVLTNHEVTENNVQQALLTLRDRVKGHPEDTVVIFLAGHTGIHDDRFSLLLPTFPFPKNDPAIVAARAAEVGPKAEESMVLPYVDLVQQPGPVRRLAAARDRRCVPGRGDLPRPRGRPDPEVHGRGLAPGEDRLRPGRTSGRAGQRGHGAEARAVDLRPAPGHGCPPVRSPARHDSDLPPHPRRRPRP